MNVYMCVYVCVYMRGHMSAHVCAWSCVRTCLWSMVIRWAPRYISHTDVFIFCCTWFVYMYKKPQLVDRLYCIHNDLSVGVRAHSTRQNPHPLLSVSAFSHSLALTHHHHHHNILLSCVSCDEVAAWVCGWVCANRSGWSKKSDGERGGW